MNSLELAQIIKQNNVSLYTVAQAIVESFKYEMENEYSYITMDALVEELDKLNLYMSAIKYGGY